MQGLMLTTCLFLLQLCLYLHIVHCLRFISLLSEPCPRPYVPIFPAGGGGGAPSDGHAAFHFASLMLHRKLDDGLAFMMGVFALFFLSDQPLARVVLPVLPLFACAVLGKFPTSLSLLVVILETWLITSLVIPFLGHLFPMFIPFHSFRFTQTTPSPFPNIKINEQDGTFKKAELESQMPVKLCNVASLMN